MSLIEDDLRAELIDEMDRLNSELSFSHKEEESNHSPRNEIRIRGEVFRNTSERDSFHITDQNQSGNFYHFN